MPQNSEQIIPIINSTTIPNTYIVYIGPTLNQLGLQTNQPDIIKRFPEILEEVESDKQQSLMQEEVYGMVRLPQSDFPRAPLCPQLTACMIMNLTSLQLENVLGMIDESELGDDQKQTLKRIRSVAASRREGGRRMMQSDNKNIPKNFTKAMFTYAITKRDILEVVLEKCNLPNQMDQFCEWVSSQKKNTHNTKQLRQLNQSRHAYVVPFRLLQQHFLRHNSVCYIFNSRIENTPAHLKAKQSIREQVFTDQVSLLK